MDYSSLALIEYERLDSGLGMNADSKQLLSDIQDTLQFQQAVMGSMMNTIGTIGSSVTESHKAVLDRMNQPKTIIRDGNGKIKGVV